MSEEVETLYNESESERHLRHQMKRELRREKTRKKQRLLRL